MIIEITRREVLNNLIRFKDSLLEKTGKKEREKRRVYRVLLNRHTGDMRFARKILALEHHLTRERKGKGAEDWKEIHLIVEQLPAAVNFEALDASDRPLNPTDVDPLAWRIASETVRVLNLKAKEVSIFSQETLPEEVVLEDLSSIHLSSGKMETLPGWLDSIDRLEAEAILWDSPRGTYLIREADPLLQRAILHLQAANRMGIHPYLITAVEQERKISDVLLLETDLGWTLFRDDPNLRNRAYKYFPTATSLIQTLHLRHPIKIF